MTALGLIAPELHSSADEFVAAVRRLRGRPDAALPLLDGPVVRRDLVRLETQGRVAGPDQPSLHPVAYLDADPFAAVAMLLARLGGRPAIAITLPDLPLADDGTLTLACGPGYVTKPLLMAAARRGNVGIFTARDLSAGCALLLRTITTGAETGRLLFDPVAPYSVAENRLGGAAVLPAPVIGRRDCRRRVVSGRASARECAVLFGGGTLCGRASDEFRPAPPGGRPTACQQGLGCYRRDLSLEEGLEQPRVNEFAAAAVFMDGCSVINIDGDFNTDISLALSLLESDAVIVAGTPVDRISCDFGAPLFASLLATGMPAGRAVAEVNRLTASVSAGENTLLGDPSISWPAEFARHTAALGRATSLTLLLRPGEVGLLDIDASATSPDRLVARQGDQALMSIPAGDGHWLVYRSDAGPLDGPVDVRASATPLVRGLARTIGPTVRDLRDLQSLCAGARADTDPDCSVLDGLGARASQLAVSSSAWPLGPDVEALDREYAQLERSVASYQEALISYLLGSNVVGYRRYIAEWPQPIRYGGLYLDSCPNCHEPSLQMRPVTAGISGPRLLIGICDSCGIDTFEGAANLPVRVTLHGQSDVPRDSAYKLTVRLTALESPILTTVGAGINEVIDDLRLSDPGPAGAGKDSGQRITTILLEPGETRELDYEANVGAMLAKGGAGLCKDMNYVGVYVLANGQLALVTSAFWLVPEDLGNASAVSSGKENGKPES